MIRRPPRVGWEKHPTLEEVDHSSPLLKARCYVPDVEAGARALRQLAEMKARRFELAGAAILDTMAERLEHFADVLDKGGEL